MSTRTGRPYGRSTGSARAMSVDAERHINTTHEDQLSTFREELSNKSSSRGKTNPTPTQEDTTEDEHHLSEQGNLHRHESQGARVKRRTNTRGVGPNDTSPALEARDQMPAHETTPAEEAWEQEANDKANPAGKARDEQTKIMASSPMNKTTNPPVRWEDYDGSEHLMGNFHMNGQRRLITLKTR
jgi:hypothetical protein